MDINISRENRRRAFFEHLTNCQCPQGKTLNWPEKKANQWISLLDKLETNELFQGCGANVESIFDITSVEEARVVYEKMQMVGLAGSSSGRPGGDNHCQTSAPFLAYFSMLMNENYFKYHASTGETVPIPEEDSYITKECFNLLKTNRNLILTGAPGTGKTFMAKRIAEMFNAETEFVQFHPSYDYTDFVEGLRPIKGTNDKELGFVRKDGLFKSFCKNALNNPDMNHVLIIDEINRGEISKILGELFFSIDPEYRGIKGKVKTQYQNMIEPSDAFANGFFVPENVYIIATMNDIDRSVESMDFAIRRRFSWKEVNYTDTKDAILDNCNAIQSIIGDVNERLENLNNAILNSSLGLGTAYQLGASYFTKLQRYSEVTDIASKFDSLWKYHIKGVVFEYLRGNEDPFACLQLLEDAFYLRKHFDSEGNIVEEIQIEETLDE
ncbi:MAG: AAA family ATPase [Bacteroidaceae bacterium]|nr:AAA family ATPase [Bacteroidaceae bacterium]